MLVDPLDRREQLLLCSGEGRALESLGAEIVFEIEAVKLNRQLRVLNAGGDFGVDRLNAQGRVYDVELFLTLAAKRSNSSGANSVVLIDSPTATSSLALTYLDSSGRCAVHHLSDAKSSVGFSMVIYIAQSY